jgi:hypothetical protein
MSNAAEHTHNGSGYERREASVRLIVNSLIGLFITVAIVLAIVYGVLKVFDKRAAAEGNAAQTSGPPPFAVGPHVEEFPAEEMKVLRGKEDAILSRYGWVDQKNGVVHIPIEKAMDEVIATLPMRPAQAAPNAAVKPPVTPGRPQGGASGNPQ